MNSIKRYHTSLTTIDSELFKQIKILAAKLDIDKIDLFEEAAHDLIKKYEHLVPSQRLSDSIWGFVVSIFIYIGTGLFGIGLLVMITMSLSSKSECDRLEELLSSNETKNQNHNPSETVTPE